MTVLLGDAGDAADAVLDDDVAMDWMGAPTDPLEMPGMATEADFDQLGAASGIEADDLFTRLMIEHHAAGIEMATYEAEHGDNDTVRALARAMARVQRIEIREMNSRRASLDLERISSDAGGHTEHASAHD
jgi:uncharacterized protein (DUF305 family)